MKLNRKPIQIATSSNADHSFAVIYALCDDGSIWYWPSTDTNPKWFQLPDVPKDDR